MEIIDWSVKNSRDLADKNRSYIKKYNETVLKKATEKLLINGTLFVNDILELERKEHMPLLSTLQMDESESERAMVYLGIIKENK